MVARMADQMPPSYVRRLALSAAIQRWPADLPVRLKEIVESALDGIAEHWAARADALTRAAAEVERGERLRHAHWLTAQRLRGELVVTLQQRDQAAANLAAAVDLLDGLVDPNEAARRFVEAHREVTS